MRSSLALLLALLLALPSRAHAAPLFGTTFPIAVTVALEEGRPARDDAWISSQIDEANALYAVTGITFRWTLRKEMPESRAHVHSRADRHALAELVEMNVIDVFVVASLEDVDEPGRYRKGVAWTSTPGRKRLLILSAAAPRSVLAHELGHFFGNGHSEATDNLMSYSRATGRVFLDDLQIARVELYAAWFLASGRLLDIGPPRLLP